MTRNRSRCIVAMIALCTVAATAACSSKSSSGSSDDSTVRIGLEAALTGAYAPVGDDIRDGFQLYLNTHGGKLGGHKVALSIADEGTGASTAAPAAQKLIKQDNVQAITGIVAGDSFAAVSQLTAADNIPLIGANARPAMTQKQLASVWTTSYLSADPGTAIASYIKDKVNGPVYVIGPNYQGGWDEVNGFTDAFKKAGGKLANPTGKTEWTPWPQTTNFLPFLSQIAASGAKAIYTFYAGGDAINFVKQYAQSDAHNIPLYAAGFLTEGGVLGAEGTSAKGIQTVLNYSPDLDNSANRTFVAAWQQAHKGAQPTTFAMASYDAATVLDQAIASIKGSVTSASINAAIGKLGQIDSPRGPWSFDAAHAPVQAWYLRKVALDGQTLANVNVQNLSTLG
jgi:branched-chain amino acid transport system substrate-binding protein